jgi:hypothetical protein
MYIILLENKLLYLLIFSFQFVFYSTSTQFPALSNKNANKNPATHAFCGASGLQAIRSRQEEKEKRNK